MLVQRALDAAVKLVPQDLSIHQGADLVPDPHPSAAGFRPLEHEGMQVLEGDFPGALQGINGVPGFFKR